MSSAQHRSANLFARDEDMLSVIFNCDSTYINQKYNDVTITWQVLNKPIYNFSVMRTLKSF